MKFYSIAIDGPSGAGKSSLAKRLAAELGFIYADTGAIYRTVGLAALKRGFDPENKGQILPMLPELEIKLCYNEQGEQRMYLDGEDVSGEIRLPEVSLAASDVSAMAEVRSFLMDMQRGLALSSSVIMDGRDIGTVVLPNADLKIFLTASAEARAERRLKELLEKGVATTFEEVLSDMIARDEQDSSRDAAPLKAAEDSVLVDTSDIGFEESLQLLRSIVRERLGI